MSGPRSSRIPAGTIFINSEGEQIIFVKDLRQGDPLSLNYIKNWRGEPLKPGQGIPAWVVTALFDHDDEQTKK